MFKETNVNEAIAAVTRPEPTPDKDGQQGSSRTETENAASKRGENDEMS